MLGVVINGSMKLVSGVWYVNHELVALYFSHFFINTSACCVCYSC